LNKREKEVIQAQLDAEKAVLKKLETQYQRVLNDINQKVKLFDSDIKGLDALLNMEGFDDGRKATLESMKQSKVYQKQYQEALKKQIAGILDKLHGDTYSTVEQYLKECYQDGYIGTMYDIQGQGVPIVVPIDQESVTKAVVLDSKVVKGYYDALGVDFDRLKKVIPAEVSRGIASSLPYIDIARNINNASKSGLYNAVRIARTEGHRIQQSATHDAQKAAKAKGADVVKQWDSTLDGRTRPTHRKLDGQIREVDEPFEVDGMKAMMPGDFGRPEEDINCRCVSLTRAKWALDDDELKTLNERAEFFELDKAKDFEDFKKKYLKASKQME
jgi:SPP1 gp7 family putative phage head morphogenesis protein